MSPNPNLLKAARIALGLNREELAAIAGVGERSIKRMEAGPPDQALRTQRAVQKALEGMGVLFLGSDENYGPGFRIPK